MKGDRNILTVTIEFQIRLKMLFTKIMFLTQLIVIKKLIFYFSNMCSCKTTQVHTCVVLRWRHLSPRKTTQVQKEKKSQFFFKLNAFIEEKEENLTLILIKEI